MHGQKVLLAIMRRYDHPDANPAFAPSAQPPVALPPVA